MGVNMYRSLIAGLEDRLRRMEHPPVITITTDFGLEDGYVGAMKGVIHTLLPDAKVVDISHDISPQQIHEGAFVVYRAYRYFPASAVHIAVVDPGVGSARRGIVLITRHGTFVGPDNGIFTYVLRAEQSPMNSLEDANKPAWMGGMWGIAPGWAGDSGRDVVGGGQKKERALPQATPTGSGSPDGLPRAYHLDNPDYWLSSVSNTFHGRDVFAPVATHLASGAQPERIGKAISLSSLVMLPVGAPRVQRTRQGTAIMGQVVYMDRFGNIITNLPEWLLAPLLSDSAVVPSIEIGGHSIQGLSHSYVDVREGQPLALIGSERLLEIAVRNSSAAQRMKVSVGDTVRIVVRDG